MPIDLHVARMFIVTLTYTKPFEEIEPLVPGHMDWVRDGFESGLFVACGRRVPRTGGVILARSGDEQALRDVLARDPFVVAGGVSVDVVEFTATSTAAGLEALKAL